MCLATPNEVARLINLKWHKVWFMRTSLQIAMGLLNKRLSVLPDSRSKTDLTVSRHGQQVFLQFKMIIQPLIVTSMQDANELSNMLPVIRCVWVSPMNKAT
jgi:hypothetical protein